jgi:hypothetical protein
MFRVKCYEGVKYIIGLHRDVMSLIESITVIKIMEVPSGAAC